MRDPNQRITTFSRDGLRFDVTDAGPLDGEVVVLLHGFPTDRTSWERVSARLHEAGLRTLAPDQRGYSPGACPRARDAYRLEELVADVLALVDVSGRERVHVVGHDWGGALAWLVACNHPDRVATVTVLSTPHPAAMARALKATLEQKRKSWYMAAFQLPWLPERTFAAGFHSLLTRSGLPPEDQRRYAARLARADALAGPINWYRAARRSHVGAHRVEVPATYVWGSRDPFLGRSAAELTREHVGGDYEFVELDAGHWLPETRDAECAAAILRRVARGS
jgi:pimeloyl-ACP methyl ester carboxylesterase